MTQQDIITELYNSHFIDHYARQFMGEADRVNTEDIIQELYLIVCEVEPDKMLEAYKEGGSSAIRGYVSGIIIKQLRSCNSRVYKKYTNRVYKEQPVGCIMQADYTNNPKLWDEVL